MTRRRTGTLVGLLLGSILISLAAPAFAALVPSKTAPAPASRETDVATVQSFLAREDVARAMAGTGLTAPQIDQRLARLSDEDLRSLAANIDQVQAAGTDVPRYIWLLLAVFLGVLILVAIF